MKNKTIFTDLYQLTMLQSYWRENMNKEATFDLFIRRLKNRNYFIVSGVYEALDYLENLSFSNEELEYIRNHNQFKDEFVDDFLANFSFNGDVWGVEDGTIMYPNEPILQISGKLVETQLVETFLLNQIGFQTNVATKASHIINVTKDQTVADFGMRRAQGTDAAIKGARSMYIAGVDATSNVAAGNKYGIPITGTMAHSYIEAHNSEFQAFKNFASLYPDTVVLVDTYDTIGGVRKVINLMNNSEIKIGGIRLDSGDLASLSKEARKILDNEGYKDVKIFASSSLDENKIETLLEKNAAIDGFGVGTKMATVSDQPYADAVYKLCEYNGKPRMKLSSGKSNLPGKKQIVRKEDTDYIVKRNEINENENCILHPLMKNGKVTVDIPSIDQIKNKVKNTKLKNRKVELSDSLEKLTDEVATELKSKEIN